MLLVGFLLHFLFNFFSLLFGALIGAAGRQFDKIFTLFAVIALLTKPDEKSFYDYLKNCISGSRPTFWNRYIFAPLAVAALDSRYFILTLNQFDFS